MTSASSSGIDAYDDVERAVMETARGRWFLNEFARRARQTDSKVILGAIERLEQRVDALARAVHPAAATPSIVAQVAPEPAEPPPLAAQRRNLHEQPIETLMARLSAALEETGRDMKAVEAGVLPDPQTVIPPVRNTTLPTGMTLEEIGKLSPEERLRLFY